MTAPKPTPAIFRALALNLMLALALLAGGARDASSASARQIDADVDDALHHFYRSVGGAKELMRDAAGVLVFPSVIKAGFGVGGEYGEGALRRQGYTEGYYNTVSASFGFQLGAQARTVIIVFMSDEALGSFRRKNGWKVGVDGSVALITVGVGGSIDSNQIKKPVIGFILDQKGLMYNLTLEGSKITRIDR
ncbi:BPSL1445 family SYLF domain-containing lipoprotein [Hyphomicrobium sp.]|uniref:BPSL1445 family SYLF domain-containing lipoprotein n=1 Tax=Hyphomicrobium sp. TaxID=82 RepID=UPI003F6EBEDB